MKMIFRANRRGWGKWLLAWLLAGGGGAAAEPPAADPVVLFDARPLRRLDLRQPAQARRLWDTWHALAALQGLANRAAPRLYVLYCRGFGVDTDSFWLDWYRGEDGWLKNRPLERVDSLEALIGRFRDCFRGLVVYDEHVPATSNAASTAAGVEGLLPVRYDPAPDSLFTRLRRGLKLPVVLWLIRPDGQPLFTGRGTIPGADAPSSGSAKIDVYRWAMARYLQPGRCDPSAAAYYLDAWWLRDPARSSSELHTLCNHDYFIAHRAFFFDLSAWGDERPADDPHQPLGADRETLFALLRRLNALRGGGMIKIGGFTPWPFKYTDARGAGGHHGGVPTEWELARVFSEFNGYLEADAPGLSAIANASFHQHYPRRARYPQPNPRPGVREWRKRGFLRADGRVRPRLYLGHYVGDYDAPSWLYKAVPRFFRDPQRGRVPLGWAFNPNLADRAPQALVYARRHATPNDFFIAGDSGAGYVNPRALTERPHSGLPPALAAWVAHCRRAYTRWDLSLTGFLLDGCAGASTEREFAAYATFSPDGMGTHFEPGPALHAGVPTCREQDLPGNVDAAADRLAAFAAEHAGRPAFFWARAILKSPGWYATLSRRLRERHPDLDFVVVDPCTFFGLIGEMLRPRSRPLKTETPPAAAERTGERN